ncbi:MAG: patatin family protein [Oscillospiraceae bacterium]|jgi:predicted patatin/cPLA2 family phospholipase|nr:patatin family protein [Oscillospiraceae bacterium]
MIDEGLILEGGGMRGVYTAGVLDCLLDHGLYFKYIYGVSAGACHGCSYVSRQRGRAAGTVLNFLRDRRYGSFRNWIATGDYFGKRFVYGDVPDVLLPFDYAAFEASGQTIFATVTNLESGKAEYVPLTELKRDMDWLRASASLPLLSRRVEIAGKVYLDGGIADSIPLARSIADGHARNLVVLTRHKGYQKPPNTSKIIRLAYRRYPAFVGASERRHEVYNESIRLVKSQADAGQALVIQPGAEVKIGRLEKDAAKLRALYDDGYRDAETRAADIAAFFAKKA